MKPKIVKTSQDEHIKSFEYPIVGIGASAGGLEALESFFKEMPSDSGMAFVVIQHLSPDYKSLMNELLARHTRMSIYPAENNMWVKPNCIYLIPPRKSMTIQNRHLQLADLDPKPGISLPIDIFFRSLAADVGKLSIGIVLSGTGSDGTLGIRSIKEAGGMVIAQDDVSAKFDGMPRSSIATGMVDFITSPEKMPDTLLGYINHPYTKNAKSQPKIADSENVLNRILHLLKEHVGVDFTYYKENTIIRRIEKRVGINQLADFEEYLTFLENSPKEIKTLYKDLLIGVTQFFRDQEAYTLLSQNFKALFENSAEKTIRIWCVGCSTGEEAYSLGILLNEVKEKMGYEHEIKIFATDLDVEHIEIAGAGFYPESIISDIPQEYLSKYFVRNKGFKVKEKLRQMIVFARQNITKDPPFSKLDLISCRNMLIYLNNDMQKRIIGNFYFSLNENGLLFLGSSESLGEHKSGFSAISNKWKIFKKIQGYNPSDQNRILMDNLKFRMGDPPVLTTLSRFSAQPAIRIGENILIDLLNDFLTSSVLINEHLSIVHVFGEVSQFIKIGSGKLSFDLLSMVSNEMAVILSSMLNKTMNDNKEVIFKDIKIKDHNKPVTLVTKPLQDPHTKVKFYLVSFAYADTPDNNQLFNTAEALDINRELSERYQQLEKDLQFSKENLQATIEELETSNEELQSTNEELVAANEELQSTNEELQSVNEELFTVNSEFQSKIEELTVLNNDMNNLLNNTRIGVLFLDQDLRIRKFTNSINRVVKILHSDLGRPVQDLSLHIDYPLFYDHVESVLETLEPKEFEVRNRDGNWILIKLMPYRNENNAVDGLALTVYEINQLKKSESKYRQLFETMTQGVVYQDATGSIIDANHAAQEILGLSIDQMKGRTSTDPRWKSIREDGSDYPGTEHPAMIALSTGQNQRDQIMGVFHPQKEEYRWIKINSTPIPNPDTRDEIQVFSTFEDITSQKQESDRRKHAEVSLLRAFDNSPIGNMVLNQNEEIIYANQLAADILGTQVTVMLKRKYDDLAWDISDQHGKPIPNQYLPFSLIFNGEKSIQQYVLMVKNAAKESIPIRINGAPMLDQQGKMDGAVFSIETCPTPELPKEASWKAYQSDSHGRTDRQAKK